MIARRFLQQAASAIIACVALSGCAKAASLYPVAPNFGVGLLRAIADPTAAPAGANLAGCRSAAHPYPVVLVNGTFAVAADDFAALAPALANAGYCVFTFNYGGAKRTDLVQAVGPVPQGAESLAAFVRRVRSATGSAKVDLVGHSQGGLVAEYYAKILRGARYVHALVGLSPSTHGTTLAGIEGLSRGYANGRGHGTGACVACRDQEAGSAVVRTLNSGPVAQPGVAYTVIETTNETVVTPVGSSFIAEKGVVNEYVQQFCPFDAVDHLDLPYDNVVIQLVKNALTPQASMRPSCFTAFPVPAF